MPDLRLFPRMLYIGDAFPGGRQTVVPDQAQVDVHVAAGWRLTPDVRGPRLFITDRTEIEDLLRDTVPAVGFKRGRGRPRKVA